MDAFSFAFIGLGLGGLYAAIALGILGTYRGTGVINFGQGAMSMWCAYVYAEVRTSGDLVLPLIGLPHRIDLGASHSMAVGLVCAIASGVVLGLASHFLVFRPLRKAPALARIVASIGILLFLQALTALQFGTQNRNVMAILPTTRVDLFGVSVGVDRIYLAMIVIACGVVVAAYFRLTRVGLATAASAENEDAIALVGYSPQLLAGITWVGAGVLGALLGVLVAPTTPLNPTTYALAVVPALAAVLLARMNSIAVAVTAALGLGAIESILKFYSSKVWWPDWLGSRLGATVPLLVIIGVLYLANDPMPSRGSIAAQKLPTVPRGLLRTRNIVTLFAVGAVLMVATSGSYRFALITSMAIGVIMISFVIATGLLGQVSLMQGAAAGLGALIVARLAGTVGLPFLVALPLAALASGVFGLIVGIAALRIRGEQLAVVTLAAAVAVADMIFKNPSVSPAGGILIPDAHLFTVDLSTRSGTTIARWQLGLFMLVAFAGVAVATRRLIVGQRGRRFIAIREDERAAASVGVQVQREKLIGFALSTSIAGLGGALLAYSRGKFSSESFEIMSNISYLVFSYLGGIASIGGAAIGAMFAPLGVSYVLVTRLLSFGTSYNVIAALSLIMTAIFNRNGIAGAARETAERIKQLRASKADARRTDPANAAAATKVADIDSDDGEVSQLLSVLRNGGSGEGSSRSGGRHPDGRLSVSDLTVRYGGLLANDRITLQVDVGRCVGLIGPNGAGKTTFIDAVSGFTASTGEVVLNDRDLTSEPAFRRVHHGVVRTWQDLGLFDELTVAENVRVAVESSGRAGEFKHADIDERVKLVIHAYGLSEYVDDKPPVLPLGIRKIVGLARAAASDPMFILMDEPAAGLDRGEAQVLGKRIRRLATDGLGVLLVDHDVELVMSVCDYIYVMNFGQLIAEGEPSEIQTNQNVIEAYLG